MSRNNYLAEAFKSMRSDDILNEEAFTLDSKGADELKQFLDGDNMDDSIQVIDPDAETPEELEDSYIGKVILDCCVCHSKLYKDKKDVVIDEDGDLANVDEECPFCYCVDGFKIVGEVKEFNKDDSDEDGKGEKDDEPKPEEKDEVEVEETEEDEKIEESVSAKRSARMKKKVRSIKESSGNGKYFDKIAKHFYYTDSADFLDLVGRIVSNIDFSNPDIDAEVLDAVNDGLTYFDDQWEILKEYSETPADANYDSAYNKFLDDMYFLAKEIAEDNGASSDDDEDDGENESLKEAVSKTDDIDAEADDKKELAKKELDKKIDDADSDRDYRLKRGITRRNESKISKEVEEAKKSGCSKKIDEAPNYELHPQYDSRKSFYGKARVDTGDKSDKNKLFSYDTLVAEIKDGNPVVYGAFSATTLRHIKDWLKQNGFKAENKAQILRDYGVKEEAKECGSQKPLNETGEWEDDEEGIAWKQSLSDKVSEVTGKKVSVSDIRGFDKYQGPYYKSNGYEFWMQDEIPVLTVGYRGKWYKVYDSDDWDKLVKGTLTPIEEAKECKGKSCRKHDIKRIEEGWRGSEEIEMIWHGSNADPELEYKGSKFNYWDIEDALWDMFLEETGHKDSEANDAEVEKEFNKYIEDHATNYLDDLIATMDEGKKCVTESVEEVSVKTDKEDISVRTDEDGKVSVETSVKEETDEGAEEIAPVSDEVRAEIEDDSEEAEIGDEIDVEMTDFDEESFDELGEAYLKKAYSNVESYKSVSATANDNRITVEGVIKFKSGNEKKTKFVLESKEVTKSGKSRFVGENLQIAKGKKAFTVFGTLSEGRFVTESLGYDYRAKDKNGKSKRISGTVTKR